MPEALSHQSCHALKTRKTLRRVAHTRTLPTLVMSPYPPPYPYHHYLTQPSLHPTTHTHYAYTYILPSHTHWERERTADRERCSEKKERKPKRETPRYPLPSRHYTHCLTHTQICIHPRTAPCLNQINPVAPTHGRRPLKLKSELKFLCLMERPQTYAKQTLRILLEPPKNH